MFVACDTVARTIGRHRIETMHCLLPLAAVVAVALGAIPADEVTSLPGWKGALPSKHYSFVTWHCLLCVDMHGL